MTRVSACHNTMTWGRASHGLPVPLGRWWSRVCRFAEALSRRAAPTAGPAPAPRRTLLVKGENGLNPFPGKGSTYYLRVKAPFAGLLEASVNWRFRSNRMDLAWGRGDLVPSPDCPILAANVGPEKPKSVFLTIPSPGTYTLVLQNQRASTESISYQIFLTR